MKIRKIYRRRCRSIKSLLSLLVSSVVNPNYFIVVLFYPFNILVALFSNLSMYIFKSTVVSDFDLLAATISSYRRRLSGVLRRRSDGLECAA